MDEANQCIVYTAMNIVLPSRGGLYIGMTGKTLEERKDRHWYSAQRGSQLHFHRALRKYGIDGFHWAIIDKQPTYRAALESERMHISYLKGSYNLYNKTDGGGGVKGLKFSEESRRKMSIAKKGKPNHWSGGRMPQHIRDKMSVAAKNRQPRDLTEADKVVLRVNAKKANVMRRKPVVCINDGVTYESATAAGLAHGLTSGQVSRYCSTNARSRRGLKFKYAVKIQ